MALFTVRQLLQDVARPILVNLTTDPNVTPREQGVAANAIPVIDSVLGDLNVNNIITSPGKRNAAVTNLRDNVKVPLAAVDRAHQLFGAGELYNALDAVSTAISLIADQVPSDEHGF